jgi:hypothetical protein
MTKPTPADPQTFAAMLAIAERIAAAHEITINAAAGGSRGPEMIDWTFRPAVKATRTEIYLSVEENRVMTAKRSRDLIIAVRAAIVAEWNAQGYEYHYKRQRTRDGWTWMHVSGYTHMGTFCKTGRYAVLLPTAKAVAA